MVALVLAAPAPLLVAAALLLVAVLAGFVLVFVVRGPRTRARVEAFFRRPPRPGGSPDPEHYYRPYWNPPSAP